MKIRLFVFVVVIWFFWIEDLASQTENQVTINGSSFEIELQNRSPKFRDEKRGFFIIRDYFEYTDESISGQFKLPSRNLIVAIPPESKVSVSLSAATEKKYFNMIPSLNPELEMLNDSIFIVREVDFANRKLAEEVKPVVEINGYLWLRDFYCVNIKLNTHKFDDRSNTISELSDIKLKFEFDKSIDIKHDSPLKSHSAIDDDIKLILANSEIAEQFRGQPQLLASDTSGNWIDYSATYLKIGTVSDGLFRIKKTDLDNFGINTSSINPQTFQLFESGIERSIFVFGEADQSFDDNDYIEFYGTKNYSKISPREINPNNLPYNNYLDKYSDTTVCFLTWNINAGKRPAEKNIFNPLITDSMDYYTHFIHLEENPMDVLFYTFHNDPVESQFPHWDTGKGWYWRFLASWSGPGNFPIQISDLVLGKSGRFFAKLTSRGSTTPTLSHKLSLFINGKQLDTQTTNRYQRVLLTGTIGSDTLVEGVNTLAVSYSDAPGAYQGLLMIDWVEAEYPRKLRLSNDSLYFQFKALTGIKEMKIKIENVGTSNVQLYKIKPSFQRITGYTIENGTLYFTDTVQNEDAYYITRQISFSRPIFFEQKTFTNLRNNSNQVDYIGVTHPKFLQSVNEYVNLIANNYSVTKDLISVKDIYDEFGYGYPTAESIRDFIIYKFQSSPSPKPSYLVLFGDANYDYKGYRTASQGIIGGGNYVPSYGYPVSDQFYVIWDSTGFKAPQMYVGRIPINKNEEMNFYKSKVENNLSRPFDKWNKTFMFFSGGRANYPNEINDYKAVHDSVTNNFIISPPLFGKYHHFYKTIDPITDFGPYPESIIRSAISDGAIIVSYLGHSGTATWDNSISEVWQLKNLVNGNPLICDFGCSTNKFSEPDIVSFGERFLLDKDGQALGYLGNSALGFNSTAVKAPGNFFKYIVRDTILQIAKAHLRAKYLMFDQMGGTLSVNQFASANTLVGDPVIKLKIPEKPNLNISAEDVIFDKNLINDATDSIKVRFALNNFGTIVPQSIKSLILHSYKGTTLKEMTEVLVLPKFSDTLTFWLNIHKKPGSHSIQIKLDTENSLSEIYEDDNDITIQIYVASTSLRDLFVNRIENPKLDSVVILNPTSKVDNSSSIILQASSNEEFGSPQEFSYPLDTCFTKISLSSININSRTWLRYKLNEASEWSAPLSYSNVQGPKFLISDNFGWQNQQLNNLRTYDDKVLINIDTVSLTIISAGGYSGQYCVITKNGINLLSNTFFQGLGVVVFDEKTMEVDTSAWFDIFNNQGSANSFAQLISSIPANKLVAVGVSGDAKNNNYAVVTDAILSLGGSRFPSLQFKAPYALFGKKGADSTQVKQLIKNPFEGPIQLDTSEVRFIKSGLLTTSQIGPSSEWKKLRVTLDQPNDSKINFRPLGVRMDGTVDTLTYLELINDEANLSWISAFEYPFIKFISKFEADSLLVSPELSKLEVDYRGISELATNYQVVFMNDDTLEQGEKGYLNFGIYNVGELPSGSLKVNVDVIKPDLSSDTIFSSNLNLDIGEKRNLLAQYDTQFEAGDRVFRVNIDSDTLVQEYYEDNNIYLKAFFIKADTTSPALLVTFNGNEILDGDYISSNPTIKMELSDPSDLPIIDSSSISILLDEVPIYFAQNSQIRYSFNPTNPKMVVEYKPKLADGEHVLKVFANDGFGNMADSAGLEKKFIVSNEMKMLDIYNYPNPIKNNTYFTFTITQVPDKIKIMVYTVAGRLVKEIVISGAELETPGFKKIFWDTRDGDGDLLGNGTYFYKVIMDAGSKTESSTHKMAIVR